LTPTVSLNPATIQYRYKYYSSGAGTAPTITISGQLAQINGVDYTFSNFSSGTNSFTHTSASQTLDITAIGQTVVQAQRNICRTGGSPRTVDNKIVFVYINGTQVGATTNGTNQSVPTCPTSTFNFYNVTLSQAIQAGDAVIVEWNDETF
jgi:hypothetical protein